MNRKKRVLICYHSSEFGGVEKQIYDIIDGLSQEFEFIVACPNGPLVKDYLSAGAVKHIDIKPKSEIDLSYSYKISRLIKEHKIDCVHSHELLTGSLATFGAWLAGCPVRIYHVHTPFSQWKYPPFKKIYALPINTIVNFIVGNVFATNVLALTPFIKDIRIWREFIFPSKITVIPNGVYLDKNKYSESGRKKIREKLGIKPNNIVIGNISRFTREKGQDILIDAFYRIYETNPNTNIKLVFAGSGDLIEEAKLKVTDLDIADKVLFIGHFDEIDKQDILSAFDLFVFPTHAEGFGIALIEAMSIGLPCVVSDIPVLRDVGGDAIEFFETGNSTALAIKIEKIMNNKDFMNKMSKKSRSQAEKYSMQNFWELYRGLFNQ